MINDELQLWSGAECTVNRVAERYLDQIERTGHAVRLDDIERIADLGARVHRFPVIWERVAPTSTDDCNFEWTDIRLAKLRERGVEPIIGLVHHGSGPRYAPIDSDEFAPALARYAKRIAERYPWVRYWTPINEPLTTARFCGLYGHWYPHGRDLRTFFRTLRSEVEATRAAMNAIRSVIPDAQLVQTEDHGRISSTPLLRYQAEYENTRRWLSFDLLTGRIDRRHALRAQLETHGYPSAALDSLLAEPSPPDVIGINYYVTSDRYLDHRLDRYPGREPGGNGRHRYVDIESVRVPEAGITGHRQIIQESWDRYRLPIALTEVHLGCTREEQIRWLRRAWRDAADAKASGIDVRGVTLWSVFGAVDWSSLLTLDRNDYEPGAYDIRGATPRPTALAKVARALSEGREDPDPIVSSPGWWECERRLAGGDSKTVNSSARPLLIVGRSRLTGRLAEDCRIRGIAVVRASIYEPQIGALVARHAPWAIVLCPELESASPVVRANGTTALIGECARWTQNAKGVPLVYLSSDLVFEGRKDTSYDEWSERSPSCPLGRAHSELEARILGHDVPSLVVRAAPHFDPNDQKNELQRVISHVRRGTSIHLVSEERFAPLGTTDLARAILDLLVDREEGIVHLASDRVLSFADLLREALRFAGIEREMRISPSGIPFGRVSTPGERRLTSVRVGALPSALTHLQANARAMCVEDRGAA